MTGPEVIACVVASVTVCAAAVLAASSVPLAAALATSPAPLNNCPAAPPTNPLISPAFKPSFRLPVSIVEPIAVPKAPAPTEPSSALLPSKPAPPAKLPAKPKIKGKNASGCPVSGFMVS